jgi:hypothetical protein
MPMRKPVRRPRRYTAPVSRQCQETVSSGARGYVYLSELREECEECDEDD